MRYKDKITEHYQKVIEGTYSCIDRLVLNAYYPQLLIPGGFRNWYGDLKGSDKDLDNAASFHIIDREWGHITIKMCSHPPYDCQEILNGNEWVENRKSGRI
ncbi:MAG: hypothetical protein WCP32_15985 [Bacteroidota bacterium]